MAAIASHLTYGQGSVFQRSRDGRWVASAELPRRRDEPRRRKTFVGATEREALMKLEAWRVDHAAPVFHGGDRVALRDAARAKGTHTPSEWWALVRSVDCRCAYCGCDAFGQLSKDHKTPLSRGGSDAIDNIAVCCRACNQEKARLTVQEYDAWRESRTGLS